MNQTLHHIPLLAAVEIEPAPTTARLFDRQRAQSLAGHLAADLARLLPGIEHTRLVVGGALFEPPELLRPGFPAWRALAVLTDSERFRGFAPEVVAFGAHAGRMPHENLQPPDSPPLGRMLALPLLLTDPDGPERERVLESELFERGSIDPPARSVISAASGSAIMHAQLLTRTDLLALHQVQLDSAGFGGFWPVVEHALIDPDQPRRFELPAGLEADWCPSDAAMSVHFVSLDQFGGGTGDYALWLRSLRSTTALLDSHGIDWHTTAEDPVTYDPESRSMIEPAGPTGDRDGLTVHHHPDLGLVAWTLIEDGRIMHRYPLDAESARANLHQLEDRMQPRVHHCDTLRTDPATGRLTPAGIPKQ